MVAVVRPTDQADAEQDSPPGRYNIPIREMPATERPRERLRDFGPGALSTPELLAILLRSGNSRQSALSIANGLVAKHGGLAGMARLSFADMLQERGLGEAKAAELQAALELGRRLSSLPPEDLVRIAAPEAIFYLMGVEMSYYPQEHVRVLLINSRGALMATSDVYIGNVSQVTVRVGEIFREPIRQMAPRMVLVHNHPGGDPSPSPEDIKVTNDVIQAGELLQIEVMDHIIIGGMKFISLQQAGQCKFVSKGLC